MELGSLISQILPTHLLMTTNFFVVPKQIKQEMSQHTQIPPIIGMEIGQMSQVRLEMTLLLWEGEMTP